MKRRDFFATLLTGSAAVTGRGAWASSRRRPAQATPPSKLDRVCISTWSFHNFFASTRDSDSKPQGADLVLLDFPQMIADRYQVHNLEFVAPHFASLEPAYLDELKASLSSARSRLVNIPVDIKQIQEGGGLSDPSPPARNAAIEASKQWIDIARVLGARSVRCDPGGMDTANLALTIDSYRTLAAYGRSRGIAVLIENHGLLGSRNPEGLVEIFRSVGGLFIGALPDFGNFPDNETRLRGLPMLFPYARTVCHSKGLKFDASGNETVFDFQKCVQISKDAGYRGVYSVEAEGEGDSYQLVQSVVNELVRYL